jgi:hypothetical protein
MRSKLILCFQTDDAHGAYLHCELNSQNGQCIFSKVFNGTAGEDFCCIDFETSSSSSVSIEVFILSADGRNVTNRKLLIGDSACIRLPTDVTYQLQVVASSYSNEFSSTNWANVYYTEMLPQSEISDVGGKL